MSRLHLGALDLLSWGLMFPTQDASGTSLEPSSCSTGLEVYSGGHDIIQRLWESFPGSLHVAQTETSPFQIQKGLLASCVVLLLICCVLGSLANCTQELLSPWALRVCTLAPWYIAAQRHCGRVRLELHGGQTAGVSLRVHLGLTLGYLLGP